VRLGINVTIPAMRRIRHDVTDSTNERAFAALADGSARHGDVHLASAQTAGRGRLGRTWHSPQGEGLYLSTILTPAPTPPAPALTIAAGLAVLDAVRALGLAYAKLKWPNDVMAGEAKLAGILVETRSRGDQPPSFVIGVGLNVAQREFPEELLAERAVTSLALEHVAATTEQVTDAVIEALMRRTDRFDEDSMTALESDYATAAGLTAEPDAGPVCVTVAAGELAGELVELTIRGGLVLRDAAGVEQRTPLELVRAVTRA